MVCRQLVFINFYLVLCGLSASEYLLSPCNFFWSELGLLPRPHTLCPVAAPSLTIWLQVSHWCWGNVAWTNCIPAVMYALDYAGKLWEIGMKSDIGKFVITLLIETFSIGTFRMCHNILSSFTGQEVLWHWLTCPLCWLCVLATSS